MKLNDKVYDVFKWVSIICLPAVSIFISGLFKLWDIPYGDQISQTITLVATLLGALLGLSAISYQISKNKEDNNESN